MKIGVCGSGILALEAAWHFERLGGSVTLFSKASLGGSLLRLADSHPHFKVAVAEGEEVTYQQFAENHLKPLIEKIESSSVVLRGEVLRVHKRFLGLDEEVSGKKRIIDLFRVVYEVQTDEGDSHESFEDVDIVIDATGVLGQPCPLGPSSSYALNENSLREKSQIFYGNNIFKAIAELKNSHDVLIVGSGKTAAITLVELEEWLSSNAKNSLTLITSEKKAFEKFFNSKSDKWLQDRLLKFIERNEEIWEEQKKSFEKEVFKWRELDDFVKAKTPQPKEPTPKVILLERNNVLAIDKWDDQDKLFATCEEAEFRGNPKAGFCTIAADQVFVATGYRVNKQLSQGLRCSWSQSGKASMSEDGSHPEPGFFSLGPINNEDRYSLFEGIKQIAKIEESILSFFERQEEGV